MSGLYDKLVFDHAKWVVGIFMLFFIALFPFADDFRLDASSDSLVLESDKSLKYYREVVANYSMGELLLLTYSPKDDLFSDAVLADLSSLREKILKLDMVTSVISIVDAPLTQSPPITLAQLAGSPPTLLDEDVDRSLAEKEFLESELYKDLLVSDDLSTTAIAVSMSSDPEVQFLLSRRNELRELNALGELTLEEQRELDTVSLLYQHESAEFGQRQTAMIAELRSIMAEHEDKAKLFLGGVPMVASDSMQFIRSDVVVFGVAALLVIILILVVAFRQFGWVMMPLLNCLATGYLMVCLLGLLNWPVSVVSSNFLSLLLIITLSLNIHLIVRYRELAKEQSESDQRRLLSDTIRSKFIPCLYTALTTMVAFASLLVSGIRPVIDFGYIMCLGIVVSMLTTFTLFPAISLALKPNKIADVKDKISEVLLSSASALQRQGLLVVLLFGGVFAVALLGITKLTVENRFVDYFKPETAIYQGMVKIDAKLGGTTPLDIILDPPADFFKPQNDRLSASLNEPPSTEGAPQISAEVEDDFEDDFADDFDDFDDVEASPNLVASSYWFNVNGINKLKAIHKSLDDMPATGKVMSLATTMSVFENLKGAKEIDDIDLGFMLNVLSEDNKKTLFEPYLSQDGNQVHINIRVFETLKGLDRNQLITDIRNSLIEDHDLKPEQVNISGMVVLYNNMLNSLFDSQIMTLGTVFVVIFLMFIVLFRSNKLALLTIVPNLFSASIVLGVMGLFSIPLDLMTITIAAISVGIAVDNSIHFVHRYRDELAINASIKQAIDLATNNVGQAMFYTTIVITSGFLIMVFSNFVPTMYFGLLTGLAMVTALVANLVMLPALLQRFGS